DGAQRAKTLIDSVALITRKAACELVEIFRSLLRHQVRHRGHGHFLKKTPDHLRCNHIATVFKQGDTRAIATRTKRNRIVTETARNHESNWRGSGLYRSFRSGGAEIGLLCALHRIRTRFDDERAFPLEAIDQALGGAAVIFIDNEDRNLRRGRAAIAEDY